MTDTEKTDDQVTTAPAILTRVDSRVDTAGWYPHDYQDGTVLALADGQVTDEELDRYFQAGVREISFSTDEYTYHFKLDQPETALNH